MRADHEGITVLNRRPARAAAVASLAALALLSGCTAWVPEEWREASAPPADPTLPACVVPDGRDLAPEDGALLGVNVEWGSQTLEDVAAAWGERPAVAVSFTDIPLDATDVENVTAAGEQVRDGGGVLLLTLEPVGGLATVTEPVIDDLVGVLSQINATGVPVVVRFAHEMNGSWYAWGHQPIAYVTAFREVASAVHQGAPGSAMMWAPNSGNGYPFPEGVSTAQPGTEDHAALDTDGDGELTAADDPYAPYYPGDDVVDWVGMSMYHWGDAHPWGENEVPEDGKLVAELTGTYDGRGGDHTGVPDFHQEYGVERGKPVAVPETAALVVPGADLTPELELEIKQAWWRQVLDPELVEQLPQVRMINWFEWVKEEAEVGTTVDWGVTTDPAIAEAFTAELPAWAVYGEATERCAAA
ncbi:glycosyl hydrolase [Actinotalea sp. C106]|uniref:glycoside hydrolase family 26 protein n=1 Tax=Actinotalea sp. C106 TaxID=2908644 RepID=UPI0020293FC4|nr:glycosyl hydrolase [Actinotalea sp. C106]